MNENTRPFSVLYVLIIFPVFLYGQTLTFSVQRGFYSAPFQLTITSSLGGTIRYTTDGSAPTPASGNIYNGPINITTTTVIRAIAYNGSVVTPVATHSYLFLQDVIHQPESIPGWPLNTYDLGNGSATAVQDYEMDPDVVNDPQYGSLIIPGLLSIPTLSVVMDKNSFWLMNDGEDSWPCSFELLYPNNPLQNEQFDGKIEAHSHLRLKRSYELLPPNDDLTSKILKSAPLFSGSATQHFGDTKIVLRAGNNDAWSRNWLGASSTYTRDEWYRSSQIAMNGYGSHGIFVHLYINGIYWGLYNPCERPDEGFLPEYFGGTTPDWLSLNHDGIRSGSATRYNYLVNTLINKDLTDSANYRELQQYLDIPKFADYMIATWMCGMDDWPANNFYGAMRNNPQEPLFYLHWDGEWTWTSQHSSNNGAWVSPYFRQTSSGGPTIAKIWNSAKVNPDFLMAFADRVYKHCFNGGAMTDSASRARWAILNNYINTAIIAESARWGDATGGSPKTRNGHWLPEVNRIDSLMNGNVNRFIQALRAEGYYPSLNPPDFSKRGGSVAAGFQLNMTNPNGTGTIYYTTDGSDPRMYGGAVAPSAVNYTGAITLNTASAVKARVKQGSIWSALQEASFSVIASQLKINEYLASNVNGLKDPYGDNDDWIEIYNTADYPIDIAGLYITDNLSNPVKAQIPAGFPNVTTIPPHGFILLWADQEMTEGPLHVNFKLSKGGEQIGLAAMGASGPVYVDSLTFGPQDDDVSEGRYPDGASFIRKFNSPTPGAPNKIPFQTGLYINEFLASNTNTLTDEFGQFDDWIEIYNSNNNPVNIGGMYITDNLANPTLWRIPDTHPAQTTIPPKGFLILWADKDTFQGPLHVNIKLSASGEQIGIVQILDSDTAFLDSLTFGPQINDVSFGRYPDGNAFMRPFTHPTPGAANLLNLTSQLYINEFLVDNTSGPVDEYGEQEAFIEIYNNNPFPVNIGGFYVTNSLTNLTLWQIPNTDTARTTIPAQGFIVLWADNQPGEGVLHLGFTLNNTGGAIGLVEVSGIDVNVIDSVHYGPQAPSVSTGRYPDKSSNFKTFTTPTPGAPNVLPLITGLYINEYLADNMSFMTDAFGGYDDWFEIYNANTFPVDIGGLFVTDDLTNPAKWQIPTSNPVLTTIPAGAFLQLWADDQANEGVLHAGFKLSKSGEQLGIFQIQDTVVHVVDSLPFGVQLSDTSEGRLPDGASTIVRFANPTPGASNISLSGNRVMSFTLVDAATGQDIRVLNDTDTINVAVLPHAEINIRANTLPATVGSVRFSLNSNANYKIENTAPYALAGDKNGNYQPWNYNFMQYTLNATPYSGTGATGSAGVSKSIVFTIINQPGNVDCNGDLNGTAFLDDCNVCSGGNTGIVPNSSCTPSCIPLEIVSFTLMHAGTAGEIGPLEDGSIINKAVTGAVNIRANVCANPVGSVKFILNGITVRLENTPPYALHGDSPAGNYNSWDPAEGSYTLTAIPYSGLGGSGTQGISKTITFTVINQNVSSCTTPADCNDSNPCTSDICNAGICQNLPLVCDDHNACSVDACYGNGQCIHTDIVCNDNNPCTIDSCDAIAGCLYIPLGSCCTTDADCDDNNPCTLDLCDQGTCIYTPLDSEPSYLHIINPAKSWRKLKLGYSSSLWSPKQNVTASGNTQMCITLRSTGTVEWNKLQVRPQGSSSGAVVLGNYISGSQPDWTTICIPLGHFNTGVFSSLSFIEIPYSDGANAFELDIQKIQFTGGTYPFLWFGDPHTSNVHDGQSGSNSALIANLIQGYPCASPKREAQEHNRFTDPEVYLHAYPNPFEHKLRIEFSLPITEKVLLEFIAIDGRKVAKLYEGPVEAQRVYQVDFQPEELLPEGMYFYRLSGERMQTHIQKLLLLKDAPGR
ncbi:MAG: hypothetical protein KatS3mg031_0585 [Chitinophagales bacterium]|nr:MAG: hypothetical protein KatS3mg031_0585 [Chitinophagales bacterium]